MGDTLEQITTDILIVGSGAAGLMCLSKCPPSLEVTLISKSDCHEGSTHYAQGGVACVIDPEDSFSSHEEDTHYAGAGLCDPEAVRVLVESGPQAIEDLMKHMSFDCDSQGKVLLGHEGAHSHRRILHAGGDATGKCIQEALTQHLDRKKLKHLPHHRLYQLCIAGDRCSGAIVTDLKNGKTFQIKARATVLACGGYSQVYQETTNPTTSTGDGVCAAFHAGAQIQDPEFVQFHPTALFLAGAPRFLISEAVRGEGAILRNQEGAAFMKEVHSMAELAPRDVVSRAIAKEMIRSKESCVFLDMSHLKSEKILKRFPTIASCCQRFGLDISKQWIPVRPAAHYTMGGVTTDLNGQTTIKQLYACGEVASTGLHGANRLASNSLLEALVFGARVGEHVASLSDATGVEKASILSKTPSKAMLDFEDVNRTIRSIMWKRVGVFRSEAQLLNVKKRLLEWLHLDLPHWGWSKASDDMKVLATNALLITEGALQRKESRGVHHREDYPRRDDEQFSRHTQLQLSHFNL